MIAKGRDNGLWKHGMYAGYSDWRYGGQRAPISLAGRSADRSSAAKRQHIVDKVVDLMRGWRSTPFEREGPIRAGLRSSFCLKGVRWHHADMEAASIVATALSILGAERPTWEQGQREFVIPRENCSWCEDPIPEKYLGSGFTKRFCSDECARSAVTYRDFETRKIDSEMYRSAMDIIIREKNPEKRCKWCDRPFNPYKGHNEYCSPECGFASRRTVHEQECPTCQKVFRPMNNFTTFCCRECANIAQRIHPQSHECAQCGKSFEHRYGRSANTYCSKACAALAKRVLPGIRKSCSWCGDTFIAREARKGHCSPGCAAAELKASRGELPRYLTRRTFDHYFTLPRITCEAA